MKSSSAERDEFSLMHRDTVMNVRWREEIAE